MTQELYQQTLLGGEVVRLPNTRIASSDHRLHTIVVNKKSLSGYDDKRFILSDQVSTLLYWHNSLREDMFYKTLLEEPDWGLRTKTSMKARSGRKIARSRRRIARRRRRVTSSIHSNGAKTTNGRKTSSKNNIQQQPFHKQAPFSAQVSTPQTQVFINGIRVKMN